MPLVDELHCLRNENTALRAQLAEQSARIEEMLQDPLIYKEALHYLTVAVEHVEALTTPKADMPKLLAKKLAYLMTGQIPRIAMRVEAADRDAMYYRFAFISLGGLK